MVNNNDFDDEFNTEEEDYEEPEELDWEHTQQELDIRNVFYEEEEVIIIKNDGGFNTIKCGTIEQAKDLYLALKNRI